MYYKGIVLGIYSWLYLFLFPYFLCNIVGVADYVAKCCTFFIPCVVRNKVLQILLQNVLHFDLQHFFATLQHRATRNF